MSDVPPHRAPGTAPTTTAETLTAVRSALAASGWVEDIDCRVRPCAVSTDEVIIAPIVGGNDTMPGSHAAAWAPGQKAEWFAAARRLAHDLGQAGWTDRGSGSTGTYFHRPARAHQAPAPIELASAPPGAPIRLLAYAAELGIQKGDLDATISEVARDRSGANRIDADKVTRQVTLSALGAQLAFLYEGCVSEAAFRALLRDATLANPNHRE